MILIKKIRINFIFYEIIYLGILLKRFPDYTLFFIINFMKLRLFVIISRIKMNFEIQKLIIAKIYIFFACYLDSNLK